MITQCPVLTIFLVMEKWENFHTEFAKTTFRSFWRF